MLPDCQDWTPVVIHNKNHSNLKKKEVKQNPAGTKEYLKLNEDEIPKLNKITYDQSKILCVSKSSQRDIAG